MTKSIVVLFLALFAAAPSLAHPIRLRGTKPQIDKVQIWLQMIAQTQIGRDFLRDVRAGNRQLWIIHDPTKRRFAGSTEVALTTALSDGRGVPEATIKLDLTMSARGTRKVVGKGGGFVSFPAVVNLFHEISHARHAMTGTTADNQEVQAILDENVFRKQMNEAFKMVNGPRLQERDPFGHDLENDSIPVD